MRSYNAANPQAARLGGRPSHWNDVRVRHTHVANTMSQLSRFTHTHTFAHVTSHRNAVPFKKQKKKTIVFMSTMKKNHIDFYLTMYYEEPLRIAHVLT